MGGGREDGGEKRGVILSLSLEARKYFRATGPKKAKPTNQGLPHVVSLQACLRSWSGNSRNGGPPFKNENPPASGFQGKGSVLSNSRFWASLDSEIQTIAFLFCKKKANFQFDFTALS